MSDYLHGTAIIWKEAGILLLGASGCGKSSLAAELIARGAVLIGDDQVKLVSEAGQMIAEAPKALEGVLELRDLALIRLPHIVRHPIHLVVHITPHGASPAPHDALKSIPSITLPPHRGDSAAKLMLYEEALQEGRVLPEDWKPSA
ncbi:MAG: serine kinase [Alphaproteobacteria bacterium]|nr:serine kinase [Alphaproteobacteria bacterium]